MHILLTLTEPDSKTHANLKSQKFFFFLPTKHFYCHNMRFSLALSIHWIRILDLHWPNITRDTSLTCLSLLVIHNRHLYKSLNSTFRSVTALQFFFSFGWKGTETGIERKPQQPLLLQMKGFLRWCARGWLVCATCSFMPPQAILVLPSQHCCYGKATDDSHEPLHVKTEVWKHFRRRPAYIWDWFVHGHACGRVL